MKNSLPPGAEFPLQETSHLELSMRSLPHRSVETCRSGVLMFTVVMFGVLVHEGICVMEITQ